MIKTVTQISVPKEWVSLNDFDSHRPLLYLSLKNTDGLVIELGSGFGSTPLLQDYCNDTNREFTTYETNKEWSEKTGSVYTDTYFKEIGQIGLLFIDCAPAEIRKELIKKWVNESKVIVVHDSEKSSQFCYGLEPTLTQFKYRLDYEPVGKPHTTIISNEINVCDWV